MFELTNEQRKYFALPLVESGWEQVKVKAAPTDMCYTYVYLDGRRIRKMILVYDEQPNIHKYIECGLDELVSEDGAFIIPKTPKGKPKRLSLSNLEKCAEKGMVLSFCQKTIHIYNPASQRDYYTNLHDEEKVNTLSQFSDWVERWCAESAARDLEELSVFARQGREHQKYAEGDFFRFKLSRMLYGYGRIILDYAKMQKSGVPCWQIFAGKPLCVAVYHVITENPNLTPEELKGKALLPSQMIMDNHFFYGNYTIIGNEPLVDDEKEYPVHYSNTISAVERGVRYQHGRTFVAMDDKTELYHGFRHSAIGFNLDVKLPILRECIKTASNALYWQMMPQWRVNSDLRNPKFAERLREVRKQMGIDK